MPISSERDGSNIGNTRENDSGENTSLQRLRIFGGGRSLSRSKLAKPGKELNVPHWRNFKFMAWCQ